MRFLQRWLAAFHLEVAFFALWAGHRLFAAGLCAIGAALHRWGRGAQAAHYCSGDAIQPIAEYNLARDLRILGGD